MLMIFLTVTAHSQAKRQSALLPGEIRTVGEHIPGTLQKHYLALGKRVIFPGRERTTHTGQMFDSSNRASTIKVVRQRHGLVSIEGLGGLISFNGRRLTGLAFPERDEALMEMFWADSFEGLIDLIDSGAVIQFLGSGFRASSEESAGHGKKTFDVFQVTAPMPFLKDQRIRIKKYLFDSDTGLHYCTIYNDMSADPPTKIETRYTLWGTIEGSRYPARIERHVNGILQYEFVSEIVSGEAASDTSEF